MCLPNACIKIKWRKKIESINPALAAGFARELKIKNSYIQFVETRFIGSHILYIKYFFPRTSKLIGGLAMRRAGAAHLVAPWCDSARARTEAACREGMSDSEPVA